MASAISQAESSWKQQLYDMRTELNAHLDSQQQDTSDTTISWKQALTHTNQQLTQLQTQTQTASTQQTKDTAGFRGALEQLRISCSTTSEQCSMQLQKLAPRLQQVVE